MNYILDLECDNLLDKVTKIHCIVMKDINTNEVFTDTNVCVEKIKEAKNLVLQVKHFVGTTNYNFNLSNLPETCD